MIMVYKMNRDGSITVFMTFVFLLLFALTGVVLDSARFFGSGGYMKVSAYGADVALYGNYNRELYQDYGLFAYGGYDGIGQADWIEEYEQILFKNIAERPSEEKRGVTSFFAKRYASVYQFGAVSVKLDETGFLTQEKQFMKQVDAWMKTTVVKDITETLLKRIKGTDHGKQKELLEGLEGTAQVENQLEQQKEEEQKKERGGNKSVQATAKATDYEKEASVSDVDSVKGDKTIGRNSGNEKNPLEFLRELMRDGVLALVCDEDCLAENEVPSREEGDTHENTVSGGKEGSNKQWDNQKSGSGILKGLLKQSDSLWEKEMFHTPKRKGKLLVYASQMFSSYTSGKECTAPYGLEYLATGERNQKNAVSAVINRLFLIRTLLNYAYVCSDPALQEESLATATGMSALLSAEAFIPVIQQSILLILSLEEACIDITALLKGKLVPIVKNQTNFQMKYEELCTASKTLFRQKAAAYPPAGEKSSLNNISQGISYVHYLWLMLLMVSWEHLYQRSLDLIQNDLQEKYNQSFHLDSCICEAKVTVTYGIPLLSSIFFVGDAKTEEDSKNDSRGMVFRQITTSYGYQ